MTDRELLEMIAAQVGTLTTQVGTLTKQVGTLPAEVGTLTTKVDNLTNDMTELKVDVRKTNNIIENDIKPKIEALFDGYKQNSDKLDRIEAEVIKHDEFILKRVK